jgi:hypothetical protein
MLSRTACAALILWAAGRGLAWGQTGDAEPAAAPAPAAAPSATTEEAVRLQRNIKRRYTELIRIMHDIARQIATADPDTSAAIEGAAAKAEEALISDDMDRVVSLLQSGLVVPADATQAKIIQRLLEVLKALQGGDELEWLLFMMEQMKEEKEALAAIVRAQRELERISRVLAYPEASRRDLGEARGALQPLRARQNDLLQRFRDLPADPISARLGSARQMVMDLDRRFEKARPVFASPYPSSDDMAMMAAQAQETMRQAIRRRTELRTLFNDPEVSAPLQKLGLSAEREQSDAAVSKAIEELEKAGKSCAENNLDEIKVAVAEAERSLQDVSSALHKIMTAMPSTKPLMGLLAEQSLVSAEIEKAAPRVERLAPVEPDRQARSEEPRAPDDGAGDTEKALAEAATRFDPAGISFVQENNLGLVGSWLERLEIAEKEMERRLREPRYPEQKEQQERVAEALRAIVMRNRERAAEDAKAGVTNAAVSAVATNAAEFKAFALPGELINDIARAMDFGTGAAKHLAAQAPVPANTNQNDALKILERALADLAATVDMQLTMLEKELIEHWIAYFHRMIMQQKACSAETLTIWGKRLPDRTFRRPEQLRLVAISKGEGRIVQDLDTVDKILAMDHGHAWVPPPKIFYLFKEMIREGVLVVRNRLVAYDPGPETQEMQRQILTWMEGALKGMMLEGTEKGDPEKPPIWGWNGLNNPDVTKRGRRVEVELMMILQQQVNARVKSLSAQLRENPGSEEVRTQWKRTIELQANVLTMAAEFTKEDDSIEAVAGPMHMGK